MKYLRPSAAKAFRDAVEGRLTADQIRLPYRDWFTDVRTIPVEERARIIDTRTGLEVVREINANI